MLQPLQLRFGSSQALLSAKGEGFSLYLFFTDQTSIAFENPNPFFPTTQQIRWAGAQRGAWPNKVADRFKSCTRSISPYHFPARTTPGLSLPCGAI